MCHSTLHNPPRFEESACLVRQENIKIYQTWEALQGKCMPFSGLRLGPGFCRLNLTVVLVQIQGNVADEVVQTHFVNQSFVWQLVEHQQVVQVRDVVGEDLVAFLHLLLKVAVADKLGTILQETLTSLLGLCSQLLDAIRDFIRILQGLLFSLMIAGKDMSTCYYSIVFFADSGLYMESKTDVLLQGIPEIT